MLQTLRVRNLAIVENINVDFREGLNVITGETGAGKSILVGALALVLGDRADKDLIRAGEEQCGVEATFQLPDSAEVDAILEEIGLAACEDGRLIVRRIVAASGAGKNLVNDSPTTVQALKRIGDLLVDMHGPHDHQSLLDSRFQIDLLDSFGHLWKARDPYEELYRQMLEAENRRRQLQGDDGTVARQLDLLKYQVKEIEQAELTLGCDEEVQREHATVANAQRILELAAVVREALTEAETSAFGGLAAVQKALSELAGMLPEAAEWQSEAKSIAVAIQELSNGVAGRVQSIEGDPARLQWLDDRLALLHKLKKKYGASVEEILKFLNEAKARLGDLETRGQRLAEAEAEVLKVRQALEGAGRQLSQQRQKAASALAKAITKELRDLGFPQGAFDVALTPCAPGPAGMDDVEFGFAPNAGEPMRALRAIASSGEISRVMLATKAVLAAHDRIPVLVFDEIDANLGGEMGNAIGAKLAAVAITHQVLCITHLPQVAVHGRTHFVVEKQVRGGRTITLIRPVSEDARVEEIARMLGGRDLTSVTLRHAKEMLQARDRKP